MSPRRSRRALLVVLVCAAGLGGPLAGTALADADLSMSVTDAPDPVAPGANLTYTLTATNVDVTDAAVVTVSDTLPAGTTFVSLSPGAWSCTAPAVGGTGTVTCWVASLAAGASSSLTLVVAVSPSAADSTLNNTARVSSVTIDGNPSNDTASASTTVGPRAEISVAASATPNLVAPGAQLVYAITVANAGPSAGPGAGFIALLPSQATFVAVTTPGGYSCPTTPAVGATGPVLCIATTSLANGDSATFSLTVKIAPGTALGTVVSTPVSSGSNAADTNLADNNLTLTATVGVAPVGIPIIRPSITGVAPATGPAGAVVVLSGSGFGGVSSVTFGGVPAAFLVDGYERITAVAPPGPSGAVDVQVANSAGTSALGAADLFTYASGSGAGSTPGVDSATSGRPGTGGRSLACSRVPTLVRHTLAYVRMVLARDGCRVSLAVSGSTRKGARVTSQTPGPGTPLYVDDVVGVVLR
jgi:uncharacterized repeat protein (TIGR01451 family)